MIAQGNKKAVSSDMISIAPMRTELVSERWIGWLNDPDVVRFSDQRFSRHTLQSQHAFIEKKLSDEKCRLYAIFYGGSHIGVIEIQDIDANSRTANLAYVIGEKQHWGKGAATAAIAKVIEIAFGELGLLRLEAGTYASNIASQKALLKNGFSQVGELADAVDSNGTRISMKRFGLSKRALHTHSHGAES